MEKIIKRGSLTKYKNYVVQEYEDQDSCTYFEGEVKDFIIKATEIIEAQGNEIADLKRELEELKKKI